ncbi:MAG: RNA-directed DNA polymerase [Gammaproteobacteria bacterium]|jgi:RNA-directed DNA polymerase
MKRAGDLYPAICQPDNLHLAFYKSARGRHSKDEVIKYREHLDHKLSFLHQQLVAERCNLGHYSFFRIRDPKPRHICAAAFPERVLHHAVMNVWEPVFEQYAIFDSYACRKGKGSLAALHRAQGFMCNTGWYLKLDIRRYFDSINHGVMQQLIARRIKDKAVLSLFSQLASQLSYPTRDGLTHWQFSIAALIQFIFRAFRSLG